MPYIAFEQFPETLGVGRTATNVSYRNDGSHWVGEVDEVAKGEQEIDAAAYAATLAANTAWDEAHPPVVVAPDAVVAPSPLAQLRDVLLADPNLAPATKDAIAAIGGGASDGTAIPMTPVKG